MLYPQTNRCRTVLSLDGVWQIKVDREEQGQQKHWPKGFTPDAVVGVPGSWNEQLAELGLMNYTGTVWYQTSFQFPQILSDKKIVLRFGSVDFHAQVWLNGEAVGSHSGGFLPFEFDITSLVRYERENLLVVAVNNKLSHQTIPQGLSAEDHAAFHREREQTFPPTVFDFLAYGGIHRPVKLIGLAPQHLQTVAVDTRIDNSDGKAGFTAEFSSATRDGDLVNILLRDGNTTVAQMTQAAKAQRVSGEFVIENCRFWSPEQPHLYRLQFELLRGDTLLDEYSIEFGVREIALDKENLLLNGKPVFLRGFGKHEDFAVIGKGYCDALLVKDFQLMKWMGANSFRTSHYPYAEEVMRLADKLGFLVIDECPAVSLNFRHVDNDTLETHKRALSHLIARDRNHACVISWSIANEPGIWMEEEARSDKAEAYWQEIYNHVRALDDSRPITLPTFSKIGVEDLGNKYCDFISINRYWGWYEFPTDLEQAGAILKREMQELFAAYEKPILVSEFGADTMEGEHATYPQLFTEEYQVHFIEKYFEVIESLPFAIGEHIWNFADFRTAQHHRRVILNKKGVFTRDRSPKSAAFAVRKHWLSQAEPETRT